jgi:hypothetical protein
LDTELKKFLLNYLKKIFLRNKNYFAIFNLKKTL